MSYIVNGNNTIGIPTSAKGVTYDNTNTELESTNVNDAISEIYSDLAYKTKSTLVLSSTLSANTDYTIEDDGIIVVKLGYSESASSYIDVILSGIEVLEHNSYPGTGNQLFPISVRKGITFKCITNSSNATITYYKYA